MDDDRDDNVFFFFLCFGFFLLESEGSGEGSGEVEIVLVVTSLIFVAGAAREEGVSRLLVLGFLACVPSTLVRQRHETVTRTNRILKANREGR